MSFYGNFSATANRLLTDKGKTFTFTRTTSSGFDPDTGTVTETTDSVSVKGIRGQLTPQDDARFEPETLVENRAAKLVCEYADLSPGDSVTFDGFEWEVIGFSPTKPAETGVLTKVLVER